MEKNLVIRQATIDDIELLLEWRMNSMQEVFGVTKEEALKLYDGTKEYFEKNIPSGNHIHCFIYRDGVLVAGGGICFSEELPSPDNPCGKAGLLMDGRTLPEYRHQGICEIQTRWLMERAFERGVNKVNLEASLMGKHLYETMGFRDFQDFMTYQKEEEESKNA